MKLYYTPGACSLSPHIVALEAGLPLTLTKVDGKAKRTEDGEDFWQINPKGYVPVLALDDGELLTENPAIAQYLADQAPASGLAPANGSMARYQLQSMLGFINSELHKSYSPLFRDDTPEATRQASKTTLQKRYKLLDELLAKQEWLLGEQFTVADAYLFVVTRWAPKLDVDLSGFPAVLAFQKRVAARPAVRKAMEAEGLTDSKAA